MDVGNSKISRRFSLESNATCMSVYIYSPESYGQLSRIHQDYVWQTRGRDLTYPGSPAENMDAAVKPLNND